MVGLDKIFSWFKNGLEPDEVQFQESWSSFWHKSEKIPDTQVLGLTETVQGFNETAEKVETSLKANNERLDRTYSFTQFKSNIVATKKQGRHLAFGSIERVATINTASYLNLNLVVWRDGINHQDSGAITGIFVSDYGEPLGEEFVIADQTKYPNIGRNGDVTPNDFRDPNLILLPNNKVLITFMYANWVGSDRDKVGSYAMIGNYDTTKRTITWDTPVVQFLQDGYYFFGKPIIDGEYLYSAVYTQPGFVVSGVNIMIARAPIANPTAWEILPNVIVSDAGLSTSEPVLRKTNTGKYIILYRYQSSVYEIRRVESSDISNGWSQPVAIYSGSSHLKGLEITSEDWLFCGIRYINSLPNGVGLLTSSSSADIAEELTLSGMVYNATTASGEAGYCEFTHLGNGRYLGMYHTEQGGFIKVFAFTLADIKNKIVKTSEANLESPVYVKDLSRTIHIGNCANRTYNLILNPLLYLPHGFPTVPYWAGLSTAISTESDAVGAGYAKVSTSGGILRQVIAQPLPRMVEAQSPVAAVRIYCNTPNRIYIRVNYGNNLQSRYHSGNGWEILYVLLESAARIPINSTGTRSNNITLEIVTDTGDALEYFVDWATVSFGRTIPDIVNDSALRMANIARINLPAQVTTVQLADIRLNAKLATGVLY